MKEHLITQIEKYTPFNRQEELDKKTILYFLRNFNDIFYRENLIAHMTASCWLVNQSCDKGRNRNNENYGSTHTSSSFCFLGYA